MKLSAKQLALREYYQEVFQEWVALDNNLQNVFTPYNLCEKMIDKVCKYCELKGKKILVTNLEFAIILIERGIDPKDICFLTDCGQKAKFGKMIGVEIMSDDFDDFFEKVQDKREVRKWDACIMNPPYQAPKEKEHEGRGKCGKSMWEDFVETSINITVNNGFACHIHPPRWRKPKSEIGKIIKSKQLLYLEMHGLKDGKEIFDCQTDYDWYILQNTSCHRETTIVDQNEEKANLKICDVPFIPDTKIKEVMALVAKEGEEKVELLWDCTYHTQTRAKDGTMQREKNDTFCYPCIYSISIDNIVSFWHSSKKEQFFGIPKVVWGNGHTGITIDTKGEFGLTQFACGIADNPKNLEKIAKALKSERFIKNIMGYKSQGGNAYDKNIIGLLRRDFFKEFIK